MDHNRERNQMKKNNKELVSMLFMEICCAYNLLENLCEGDINELDELDPSLAYLFLRLDDLMEWGDNRFDLFREIDNVEEYECAHDFLKFHVPLCEDCESDEFKYFMVQDEIWKEFGCGEGLLCLECLEKRAGHKMIFEDFTECPLNNENEYIQGLKTPILN